MSKFWTASTILLLVGLILLFYPVAADGINFTDLETECRYDRGTMTDMDLNNRRLGFEGNFPVPNPEVDLSYDYRTDGQNIVLNVKSSDAEPLFDFYNDCKAVAIYDARTDKIEEGTYMVTVRHNGEKIERKVMEIG